MSKKITVQSIADKNGLSFSYTEQLLHHGMTAEHIHTKDVHEQRDLALHNLDQQIDYYKKNKHLYRNSQAHKGPHLQNLAEANNIENPDTGADIEVGDIPTFARGGEITTKQLEQTPAGGALVGEKSGQTIIHNDGKLGGYLVGRPHTNNGIKAINKSTGQPLEMQGKEVVITAPAVEDNTKREFEGQQLTNREILSKINESGGGVSFAAGGEVPSHIYCNGGQFNYGGKVMSSGEIIHHMNSSCGCQHEKEKMEQGGEFKMPENIDWDAVFKDANNPQNNQGPDLVVEENKELIAKLNTLFDKEIEENSASANVWQNKKYKKNTDYVFIGGDDIHGEGAQIGYINEKRRQNKIKAFLYNIEVLQKAKEILSNYDLHSDGNMAENIKSSFQKLDYLKNGRKISYRDQMILDDAYDKIITALKKDVKAFESGGNLSNQAEVLTDFSQYELWENSLPWLKQVEVVKRYKDGSFQGLFNIEGTNNTDINIEYVRLKIEKYILRQILENLESGKPVNQADIDFFKSDKSALYKNYGVPIGLQRAIANSGSNKKFEDGGKVESAIPQELLHRLKNVHIEGVVGLAMKNNPAGLLEFIQQQATGFDSKYSSVSDNCFKQMSEMTGDEQLVIDCVKLLPDDKKEMVRQYNQAKIMPAGLIAALSKDEDVYVLLFHKTTDAELSQGLQVAYKDTYGEYSKIGTIVAINKIKGVLYYDVEGENTIGEYTADELKLLQKKNNFKSGGNLNSQKEYLIKNLKKIINDDEAWKILDSDKELKGSDWLGGACLPLAKALKKVIGGELKTVADANGKAQHIVLYVDGKYLDADGYQSAAKKISNIEMDGVFDAKIIDFDTNDLNGIGTGGKDFVNKLVEYFKKKSNNNFESGGQVNTDQKVTSSRVGKKLFHGTSHSGAFDRENDGIIWFTDDYRIADQYRKRNVLINDLDWDKVEGNSEEITESSSAIEVVAEEYSIDLKKGEVIEVVINPANPVDLTEFDVNVDDVSQVWDALHGLKLVDERWDELDEFVQMEIEDEFKGKAIWLLLESEGVYEKAKKLGYDAVLINDVGIEGKQHISYGIFGLKNVILPDGYESGGLVKNNSENKGVLVNEFVNKYSVAQLDKLIDQLETSMKDILIQKDIKRAESLNKLIGKVIDARNEKNQSLLPQEVKVDSGRVEVKAKNNVKLIKEAVKNNAKKVEVIFNEPYNEAEHGNLPEKLKLTLRGNKKEIFDVVNEGSEILELVNSKDVKSIKYISEATEQNTIDEFKTIKSTNINTVRDLANLDAVEQMGLISGAVFSSLKKGDKLTVAGKTYTAERVSKPTENSYYTKDNKKIDYKKSTITIKGVDGKPIIGEFWQYKNGSGDWIGRSSTKKSDKWGQLSRNIEGDITIDLINEFNNFHEPSDSFKKAQEFIDNFNELKSEQKFSKGGELKIYSDTSRYNSEIKVGQKYYDNRYGDYYTIEKLEPFGDFDVTATLKYDKGKVREEKGSFLLYHIDAKQHSLSKDQPASFEAGGELTTYNKRVQENLKEMGTPAEQWKSVPIIGFNEIEVKGKIKKMPIFDFPANYKEAPTLFPMDNSGIYNCELCSKTGITTVYHLQNDKHKWLLKVGSECVTHFGEGKSGKENERQYKILMAKMLDSDMQKFASQIFRTFSREEYIGYGRKERRWKSFYTGINGSDYISSQQEKIKEINPVLLYEPSKSGERDMNNLKWLYVYKQLPVFNYEKQLQYEKRTSKEFSEEPVNKSLLSWYTRNGKTGTELLIQLIGMLNIFKKELPENFDLHSEYLDLLKIVKE